MRRIADGAWEWALGYATRLGIGCMLSDAQASQEGETKATPALPLPLVPRAAPGSSCSVRTSLPCDDRNA